MGNTILSYTRHGVVVLLFAVSTAYGAPKDLPTVDGVPTATAESVGMSSKRLERLDQVMREHRLVDLGHHLGLHFIKFFLGGDILG